MNAEFSSVYFSALLPTDTPWLHSPLCVSWTPVHCMKGGLEVHLGAGTALPVLLNCYCGPWHGSGPGKRALFAATPGRLLGVSTNPSPVAVGSLDAAMLFQGLVELELSCSVLIAPMAKEQVLALWSSPA